MTCGVKREYWSGLEVLIIRFSELQSVGFGDLCAYAGPLALQSLSSRYVLPRACVQAWGCRYSLFVG